MFGGESDQQPRGRKNKNRTSKKAEFGALGVFWQRVLLMDIRAGLEK